MDESHAKEMLTYALTDIGESAVLTTAPTLEQLQALDALTASTEVAPTLVTDSLDLDSGLMWMEVVAAIRADVEGEEDTSPTH